MGVVACDYAYYSLAVTRNLTCLYIHTTMWLYVVRIPFLVGVDLAHICISEQYDNCACYSLYTIYLYFWVVLV